MNRFFLPNEDFARLSLFGDLFGGAEIWIAVAYVIGMFLLLAFRPERVTRVGAFRRSYVLFALYLILPGVVRSLLFLSMIDNTSKPEGAVVVIVFQWTHTAGQILLGLAIASGLGSMVGRQLWQPTRPRDADRPADET
jgi:hypothetical protein